jgi:hypothetical protein
MVVIPIVHKLTTYFVGPEEALKGVNEGSKRNYEDNIWILLKSIEALIFWRWNDNFS